MIARRNLLAGFGATLYNCAVRPSEASTYRSPDDRVVTLAPEKSGAIFRENFNRLVRELSNSGGGTVRLLPGDFMTDGPLVLLDNIRLIGHAHSGPHASVIKLVDDAPTMERRAGILRVRREGGGPDGRIVSNITISDLVIDGNRDAQRQGREEDEGKHGLYGEVRSTALRRITIRNCMGHGFDMHGDSRNEPSQRTIIEDCRAYRNLLDGFILDGQRWVICRRNVAERNGRAGMNIITDTRDALIENNVCSWNAGAGIFAQNGARNLDISGNDVIGNSREGIFLRETPDCLVTGNMISDNGRAGILIAGGWQIAVDQNTTKTNLRDPQTSQAEVQLEGHAAKGVENVLVIGNTIRAARNAAVFETHDCRRNLVIKNEFATLAGGIVLSGSGSRAEENVELGF